MKILFLDIDGVANCETTTQKCGPFIGICPDRAALVKKIVQETGVKVVLSSTWREHPDMALAVAREIVPYIDKTPVLRGKRGFEVAAWLKDNPEVTLYAALDDNDDFLPDQKLFQTTWENGLTPEIAEQVIEYFNAEDKK